jgi:hypothetical protein
MKRVPLIARFALALCVAAPAARAQNYDFSAATALLADNVALYSGGVFVQVLRDDTEIFTFQSGGVADAQLPMASATK